MEPSPDLEASPVLPSVSNIKRSSSVLIITLLLGWGFDFLFWGRPVGINLSIYITACLLGGLALLLANGIKPAFKVWG